jgi:hypothetical protein
MTFSSWISVSNIFLVLKSKWLHRFLLCRLKAIFLYATVRNDYSEHFFNKWCAIFSYIGLNHLLEKNRAQEDLICGYWYYNHRSSVYTNHVLQFSEFGIARNWFSPWPLNHSNTSNVVADITMLNTWYITIGFSCHVFPKVPVQFQKALWILFINLSSWYLHVISFTTISPRHLTYMDSSVLSSYQKDVVPRSP